MAITTVKLNPSVIIIPEGRREVNYEKVSELAESIKILGLMSPITVRQVDEGYVLICGVHRLEACKHLGHTEIECMVLNCEGLQAELAEIDENLIRNELHFTERGNLANRREKILDALGIRAKAGQGRPSKNSAGSAPLKKTEDIAREMGMSKRTLQVEKQIASGLTTEAKAAIREKKISKHTAINISKLAPDKQMEAIAQCEKESKCAEEFNKYVQDGVHNGKKLRRSIKTIQDWAEQARTISDLLNELPEMVASQEQEAVVSELRDTVLGHCEAITATLCPRLFIGTEDVTATGYKTQWGFVVCQGSQARMGEIAKTDKAKQERQRLLDEGILREENGVYIFTQDYEFDFPALAANIVLAEPGNGADEWKDANGVRVGELRKRK